MLPFGIITTEIKTILSKVGVQYIVSFFAIFVGFPQVWIQISLNDLLKVLTISK